MSLDRIVLQVQDSQSSQETVSGNKHVENDMAMHVACQQIFKHHIAFYTRPTYTDKILTHVGGGVALPAFPIWRHRKLVVQFQYNLEVLKIEGPNSVNQLRSQALEPRAVMSEGQRASILTSAHLPCLLLLDPDSGWVAQYPPTMMRAAFYLSLQIQMLISSIIGLKHIQK